MPPPSSVCLLLLSGLPGAGKSTLRESLQHLDTHTCGTPAHGLLEMAAVVELDDYLYKKGDDSFTPEAWRVACAATREEVSRQLRNVPLESGTMRLVLLVDTMPYRSMRAAYWRLCRDLCRERLLSNEVNSAGHGAMVCMAEAWMRTPVEICLQRNEGRAGTPQYIPPYVIKSMHDGVDHADVAFITGGKDTYWGLLPRQGSSPWPVLVLREDGCALPPADLARELVSSLLSEEMMHQLGEQVVAVTRATEREQERAEPHELPSGCGSALHQADLHMRAVVRHYMADMKASGAMRPGTGRLVSQWREEHYTRAKRALQHGGDAGEAGVQAEMIEFERRLALLKNEE